MKKGILLFLFLWQLSIYAQIESGITFSEVMFAPLETNGEFIELYNSSPDSLINLTKFHFIYSTSKADTIIGLKNGMVLPPKSYAIIFENDYDFTNGVYQNLVPHAALILQIDNGKFGSRGMANTSDRTIYLFDEVGDTIDTYTYSANNSAGISDEKIDVEISNSGENWGNSVLIHGTPGFKNSISPSDYDLEIASLEYYPEIIFMESEIEFNFQIKNKGNTEATNFKVKLFIDLNNDSLAQSNEIILQQTESLLQSEDSLEYNVVKSISKSGVFNIFGDITFAEDENRENNSISTTILIRPKPNEYTDIVINEIMFKPNNDEPEWIELFNRSDLPINLKNWRLADRTSKPKIIDSLYFIGANEFVVLTEDEAITEYYEIASNIIVLNLPSLNNMGDDLKLIDSLGRVIDSVNYKSEWGSVGGYSLEKIDVDKDGNDSTNWNSCNSKQFATPGEINSVTQKNIDLAITDFIMFNNYGVIGESFNVKMKIKNIGLNSVNSFSLSLFHDQNINGIPEDDELIEGISGSTINNGDSVVVEYDLIDFTEGENRYIAKIILDNDNNYENNERSISFIGIKINEVRNDIIINEIMHTPKSPEPEWIEIFNRSSKTVNLMNYQIADLVDTARCVVAEIVINPNEYFVFADDSSFIQINPDVENYIIAPLPNLNNAGDKVILLDSLNRIIDSLQYSSSWGGRSGKSLERIEAEYSSTDSANWSSANLLIGGTPGYENSISPRDYDLEVFSINIYPEEIFVDDEIEFNLLIKNRGKKVADNYYVKLFVDLNHDSLAQNEEIILSKNESFLQSRDSLNYSMFSSISKNGMFNILGEITFQKDEVTENDVFVTTILVRPKRNEFSDIIINEIMFKPNNDEPEWIELFNRSNFAINLKDWRFADRTSKPKIIDSLYFIGANEYLILAEDETIIDYYEITSNIILLNLPSFNNTDDDLKIIDSLGQVIDSVCYSSDWGGGGGFSLEKIFVNNEGNDSTNWKTCNSKYFATPGKMNSVTPRNIDLAITEFTTTNEYAIIGERVNVKIKIENMGLTFVDNYSLSIFHDRNLNGIPDDDELTNEISGSPINSGDSIVISYDLENYLEGINKYIGKVFLDNDDNMENNDKSISFIGVKIREVKNDLVINEIMYSPTNTEPEWIEIYNRSSKSINLMNYQIADMNDTTIVLADNMLLLPMQYYVFADDSSFIQLFPEVNNYVITSFPNLNNSGDKVILLDSLNRVIDSLQYTYEWGGTNGKSLERIESEHSSVDLTNWGSSMDIELSTPGKKNSITPFAFDLMIAKINTLPKSPILDDEIIFEITIKNVGLIDTENFSVKISCEANGDNSILDEIIGEGISIGDSLILKSTDSIHLKDSVLVKVELIYNFDKNNDNNYFEIVIHPGAKRNSIIINEFMANPNRNEAEWIELLNNSNRSYDISTWFISDLFTTPKEKQLAESSVIIGENEYLVITNDTSKYLTIGNERVIEVKFGALGNIEDGILLYDFNMSVVDSLKYDKDWEISKGRSLERLSTYSKTSDYSNWLLSLSASGSSPGVSNSILEAEPAKENSIIINEIMYDPNVDNSEFIELYNSAEAPIDIGGWQLIDGSNNYYEISPTFLKIEPNQYVLFASDSLIFSNYGELLNNSALMILESGSFSFSNIGESLVIIDHWGNMIDSVCYNPKWHNKNIVTTKNKSLERISPLLDGNESSNWSTSVNKYGATPGSQNSIYTENRNNKSGLAFEPNPFSPDNDGFEDFSIINYSLPFITAQIRIKIFDDKGRLVRTLVNNEASSSKGSIVFDGLNDSGNPLRIGMYIVFLEAVDTKSGESIAFKDVIVVARKL